MDDVVLEIFVLSVLRAGPGAVHGYELKRRVQRPSLTQLSNNSLYPMLRRFEADGLVTKTVEEQTGKPTRNLYTITDAGRARLTELLRTLPPDLAGDDEEFLVRVGFFEEIPPDHRRAILAARTAVLTASHAQVTRLVSESGHGPVWRTRAMAHVLETYERELTWVAELSGQSDTKAAES